MKTKKQTEAQVLGRKGERWFQNSIPSEWVFEKPSDDFGIDAKVYIGNKGELHGLGFGVQVKASKKWKIKNGCLSLRIESASLGLWATMSTPILIVLYDESLEAGFYSWVYDLLPDPIIETVLKLREKKTITVKVPLENSINQDCWQKIVNDVDRKTVDLANALAQRNLTYTILPTINRLLKDFRTLYLIEHYQQPSTNNEIKMAAFAQIAAHRDVIDSLKSLRQKYHYETDAAKVLKALEKVYRVHSESFMKDIDGISGEASLVNYSHSKMAENRSMMLNLLLELCLIMSASIKDFEGGLRFPGFDINAIPNLG